MSSDSFLSQVKHLIDVVDLQPTPQLKIEASVRLYDTLIQRADCLNSYPKLAEVAKEKLVEFEPWGFPNPHFYFQVIFGEDYEDYKMKNHVKTNAKRKPEQEDQNNKLQRFF